MQVINGVAQLNQALAKSVVTIGNFDGLHLGHREIISRLKQKAEQLHAKSVAMTFHPHPRKVLTPQAHVTRIFDLKDQEVQMQQLGLDYLVREPFSRKFSQMSPSEFLKEKICKPFNPAAVVVGYDFAFGKNRTGNLESLEKDLNKLGVELEVVPPVKFESYIVSSSAIRKLLAEGNVTLVQEFLGRPFYLKGVVEKGDARGRKLGFPTANLSTAAETFPANGVYTTNAIVRGKVYSSVTNIGLAPTFVSEKDKIKVETHILDFDEDIYGEELEVHFLHFIRKERKFQSKEDLVEQIKNDILKAKSLRDFNESL